MQKWIVIPFIRWLPIFFSNQLHALAYKYFWPIYSPLYFGFPYLLHILVGILWQGSGIFSAINECHPAIWAACSGFIARPEASMREKEDRKREMSSEKKKKERRISYLTYGGHSIPSAYLSINVFFFLKVIGYHCLQQRFFKINSIM